MRIEQATSTNVTDLWSEVEPAVSRADVLEEAAQELATALHGRFEESVVLARVYLTVAFGSLPKVNEQFVRALAEGAGANGELRPETPVLSLVGTHGKEGEWQDRRDSRGHVGIPLISASFIDAIPMISRLLHELGVGLDWADTADLEFIKKMGTGLFFVDDAAQATDQQGRHIIPVQDFVSDYGVTSVFGVGGAYDTGQMLVLVVFTGDRLDRDSAECFLPLNDWFRGATQVLVEGEKIFHPG